MTLPLPQGFQQPLDCPPEFREHPVAPICDLHTEEMLPPHGTIRMVTTCSIQEGLGLSSRNRTLNLVQNKYMRIESVGPDLFSPACVHEATKGKP